MRRLYYLGEVPVIREITAVFHQMWDLFVPLAVLVLFTVVGAILARFVHAGVIRSGRILRLDRLIGQVPLESFPSPSSGLARILQVTVIVASFLVGLRVAVPPVGNRVLELFARGRDDGLLVFSLGVITVFTGWILGKVLQYFWRLSGRGRGEMIAPALTWTLFGGSGWIVLEKIWVVESPGFYFVWAGWLLGSAVVIIFRDSILNRRRGRSS